MENPNHVPLPTTLVVKNRSINLGFWIDPDYKGAGLGDFELTIFRFIHPLGVGLVPSLMTNYVDARCAAFHRVLRICNYLITKTIFHQLRLAKV